MLQTRESLNHPIDSLEDRLRGFAEDIAWWTNNPIEPEKDWRLVENSEYKRRLLDIIAITRHLLYIRKHSNDPKVQPIVDALISRANILSCQPKLLAMV